MTLRLRVVILCDRVPIAVNYVPRRLSHLPILTNVYAQSLMSISCVNEEVKLSELQALEATPAPCYTIQQQLTIHASNSH
jgi:hypothetical protein